MKTFSINIHEFLKKFNQEYRFLYDNYDRVDAPSTRSSPTRRRWTPSTRSPRSTKFSSVNL